MSYSPGDEFTGDVSDCCQAPIYQIGDICSNCSDHCCVFNIYELIIEELMRVWNPSTDGPESPEYEDIPWEDMYELLMVGEFGKVECEDGICELKIDWVHSKTKKEYIYRFEDIA